MMSIVKITNKRQLDELLAKLTMRMGRKPTQQEVLDLCVTIGSENFEEIAQRLFPSPILDEAKYQRIQKMRKDMAKGEWIPLDEIEGENEDDKLIYGRD